MNRQHFLKTAALTLAGPLFTHPLTAMEPLKRKGTARFRLGLAAYSFRQQFRWMRGKEQKPGGWSILDFIDWCADHEVPGAELTSYFFPPDADAAYCREVRRHAWLRGVSITGTAIGNNWALPLGPERDKEIAECKRWTELAAALGAPHIRVFAGSPPKGYAEAEALKTCIAAYQECLDHAAGHGIFLGMENHHGLVAKSEGLLAILKGVTSPWAGANFDSGNFFTEDPYADLASIAPYAVNVQLKLRVKPAGDKIGQPTDVAKVLKILTDANYQGWFTLEYEEPEDALQRVPAELKRLRELL